MNTGFTTCSVLRNTPRCIYGRSAMEQYHAKPRVSYSEFMVRRGEYAPNTLGWAIQKYLLERQSGGRPIGESHRIILQLVQRSRIAAKPIVALKPLDYIEHCKARLNDDKVLPQTVMHDVTTISGVLRHAADLWEMEEAEPALVALKKAKSQMMKLQIIGKSQRRTRRPALDELGRIFAAYEEQEKHRMTKIPMRQIVEFQIYSGRRIGETCRLRWSDVDFDKKVCLVRDLKNPKGKGFHDTFPLLGRAWEIVLEREKERDQAEDRIFPYLSKSCSASFTAVKHKLGINGLRLHDCRREAISRLFEQGYNVPEVAKVSLHRNPTQLLGTYTALKAEDLHKGPAAKREAATP